MTHPLADGGFDDGTDPVGVLDLFTDLAPSAALDACREALEGLHADDDPAAVAFGRRLVRLAHERLVPDRAEFVEGAAL